MSINKDFDEDFAHMARTKVNSMETELGSFVSDSLDGAGLNNEISLLEVQQAIFKAKADKAPGWDAIPAKVIKNEACIKYLTSLFQTCFMSGIIPSQWLCSIIQPIPKHGEDPSDPLTGYRGIALTSAIYKVYCDILNIRLTQWAEDNGKLCEEQNGFRKARNCIDHIFVLSAILENRLGKKKETFACFVDARKAFDCVDRDLLWFRLISMGVSGTFLNALRSLYKGVKACVRINGKLIDWFNVDLGVKQGCLLSPCLFNLFFDSLSDEIKSLRKGVPFGNEKLSILLYADDVVLLAETEADLQIMLDVLYKWCIKWRLEINDTKTQVIHFRNPSKQRSNVQFYCGDQLLKTVPQYKYPGLVFNEFHDLAQTAKSVAASASRALGLIISKFYANGGMPYKVFTKVYESLVAPVIDYGAAIWGTREFSCINAVQNRACQVFLGLGRYAPNAGVQGEMGWFLPIHKQWMSISRFRCRLSQMSEDRLPSKVFKWALAQNIRKTWPTKVRKQFETLGLHRLNDVNDVVAFPEIGQDLSDELLNDCNLKWQATLDRETSNKLRTYRLLKTEFISEPYLEMPISRKERKALAKVRCGVAPLRLETGRWEKRNNIQIPHEERVCLNCFKNGFIDTENEEHFLLRCLHPDLKVLGENLLRKACTVLPSFIYLNDTAKLVFLLSNCDIIFFSAKTCSKMLNIRTDVSRTDFI